MANANSADREIAASQHVKATPQQVFDAWTDPIHLQRWWALDGFTTSTSSFDFRPGGIWVNMLHWKDGGAFPNVVIFREIEPAKRIVFAIADGQDPKAAEAFETAATFDADESGTTITFRTLYPSAEARDQAIRDFNAIEGTKVTLRRLVDYVTETVNAR